MHGLHFLSGQLVQLDHEFLRDPDNRIGKLIAAGKSDAQMLDEFYLAALARQPSATERVQLLTYVEGAKDRRAAWEDVVWGLVNAKEFLLRR